VRYMVTVRMDQCVEEDADLGEVFGVHIVRSAATLTEARVAALRLLAEVAPVVVPLEPDPPSGEEE